MDKNLRLLLNYRRLAAIRRCNNLPTINTVDVAQHSYYTAMLAFTLAQDYNQNVAKHNFQYHPYDVDNLKPVIKAHVAMEKAMFHDVEEAFTSDIPWNVKHHSEAAHKAISEVIKQKIDKVYDGCSDVFLSHKSIMESCKDDSIEGQLVDIVDSLECAWYCYQEVTMGNEYLGSMLKKCCELIKAMPLSTELFEYSPLFEDMMTQFTNATEYIDETMNID